MHASKLKKLFELKRKISHLQLEGIETMSVSEYENTLNTYNRHKDELEEIISQKISLDLYSDIFDENIRQHISSKLEEEDILIEFMKFNHFNFEENKNENPEYFALLMFSNQPNNIKHIKLGNADIIDALIKDVLANIKNNKELVDFSKGSPIESLTKLSDILLKPIIENIDVCKKIYIVPDSELYRIPFEVLLLSKGKFAIEKYQFLYLNSGRDLISHQKNQEVKNFSESAIVANPNYNLAAKKIAHVNNEEPNRLGLTIVKDLSETIKEAEKISEIINVRPIIKEKATKRKILELSSPEYLHFATHGYFLPRNPSLENNEMAFISSNNIYKNKLSYIQNPMLRSGLILAGFNSWLRYEEVPDEVGDGLLTAMNIAEMDLSNTKLVVLSACETGLGDIDNGEGVFGLRRAFKIAGAKRIVMSLWKVPDKETRLLMTDFYRSFYEDEIPFYEAFRKTQLNFINNINRNPYYWSAFIFQGVEN